MTTTTAEAASEQNDPSTTWRNTKLSSRVRVALYLAQEIGEGTVFSKNDMRDSLPGIEQIDRRMRELREVGWVIRNYKDSATLAPSELQLETIGQEVWQAGYKLPSASRVSNAVKRNVFDRDNNRCVVCGVGAGEAYPDRPEELARMTIGHLVPRGRAGWNDHDNLRTECALCNETARHLTESPVDVPLLKARIKELPRRERATLASWVLADKRSFAEIERLWAQYRQLPAPQRDDIKTQLAEYIVDGA